MATNEYLPFGTATGANAISTTAYNSLAARLTGFAAGVALSQQVNKPLRQTSSIASMIGAFIAGAGYNALDNGDLTTLQANFELALKKIIEDNLPDTVDLSGYLLKSGGTMTGLLKAPAGLQTTAATLSSAATLTTADSGKFIEITAPSTIITSLPTPVGNGGINYTIWANSVSAQTIRTAIAGAFQGPGSSGATTMSLPAGSVVSIFSDGYNWIVGSYKEVPVDTSAIPKLTVFSSSTVWTKAVSATHAIMLAHGAGGAGGGSKTLTGNQIASGGGAGGISLSLVDISSVSSATVTIAAGGTAVTSANGGDGGGNTSIGSYVIAKPGRGGYINGSSTSTSGVGGDAGTGQISIPGMCGAPPALYGSGSGGGLGGGQGGDNQSGRPQGSAGTWGGGGGGSEAQNLAGGAGGSGWAMIYEFRAA